MQMKNVDPRDMNNEKSSNNKNKPISDEELIKKTVQAMNKEAMNNIGQQSNLQSEVVKNMQNEGNKNDGNYFPIEGIPSKYKLYPEGMRILGRPLKVIEVKKLSSINDDNVEFIVNEILQNAIKGIKVNDILVADKIFLILWLRANTYRDSGYVVDFVCSKCEKKSEFHFSIDDLEVKYLSDEYNPNKKITLQNGDKLTFRFLTIGDEISLDRFVEMNNSTVVSEFDSELLRLSAMISSINGNNVGLLERYNYILEMSPPDLSYITSYLEKYGMGMQPYINVQCKKCGGTSPVGISFRPDFFIPSYKFE